MKTSCRQKWLVPLAAALLTASACGDSQDPSGSFASLPGTVTQTMVESAAPVTQDITLSNGGDCALDFNVAAQTTNGGSWLAVSPGSGTVNRGTPQTLTITFTVTGPPALTPGTYSGALTVTGTCQGNSRPATGSPALVAVNLTVTSGNATIEIQPTVNQDVVDLQDSWKQMDALGAPTERRGQSGVWTGYEMIIWGGTGGLATGRRYIPLLDRWIALPSNGPAGVRSYHSAVWTGDRMIVWGGINELTAEQNSGFVYDPIANAWAPTGATGDVPEGRRWHTALWTGSRMIVWGGEGQTAILNSGGVYDPGGGSWVKTNDAQGSGVPEPKAFHSAIWTGSKMIVWGGLAEIGQPPSNTGGIYDPATDSWIATSIDLAPLARDAHTAVWTGTEMIVWGGESGSTVFATGARFNPTTGTWTRIADAPIARVFHRAVWTGKRMVVWGGVDDSGNFPIIGAAYDPVADSWTQMRTPPAELVGRILHTMVWTGTEMIVWGGEGQGLAALGSGAIYQ